MQGTEGWSDTPSSSDCADSFDPKAILARAVRSEVVGRLRVDRKGGTDEPVAFDAAQRSLFLDAMLSGDRETFDGAVADLSLHTVPFAQTLRNLITPVLDDLGQMWRDDEASFVDVTLATCRVQTFLCEKLVAVNARDRGGARHGSIAFARPVGESHTLGLTVATECFRIDGWTVLGGVDLEVGEGLWALLSGHHVDVLGLSVGSASQAPAAAEAIRRARAVSRNPALVVGLGGYCTIAAPEALRDIGADFTASDALDAVDMAASFLGRELVV